MTIRKRITSALMALMMAAGGAVAAVETVVSDFGTGNNSIVAEAISINDYIPTKVYVDKNNYLELSFKAGTRDAEVSLESNYGNIKFEKSGNYYKTNVKYDPKKPTFDISSIAYYLPNGGGACAKKYSSAITIDINTYAAKEFTNTEIIDEGNNAVISWTLPKGVNFNNIGIYTFDKSSGYVRIATAKGNATSVSVPLNKIIDVNNKTNKTNMTLYIRGWGNSDGTIYTGYKNGTNTLSKVKFDVIYSNAFHINQSN